MRRFRPLLLLLAATAAAFAVAIPAVATETDFSDPTGEDRAAMIQESERFRSEFGLSTDPDLIASLVDDPATDRDEWGVPLTQSEQQELQRRLDVADEVRLIERYAEIQAGETFAGLYVDQRQGGLVYVGFTDGGGAHMDALREAFPYPELLRSFQASHSLSQLEAKTEAITGDLEALAADGIDVRSVAPDVPSNSVKVGVVKPEPDAADRLQRRYGKAVRVEEIADVASTGRGNDAPPVKGGHKITSYQALTRYDCTSAFVMNDRLSNDKYLMTAGHCGDNGSTWFNGSYLIGFMRRDSFRYGSLADAALIDINELHKSNLVYLSASNDRPIRQAASGDFVGQPICMSAWRSGVRCGSITRKGVSVFYSDSGVKLQDQRYSSFGTNFGDSGGPIYSSRTAHGVISGFAQFSDGSKEGIYSFVENAQNAMNANVRTCCN